MEISLRRNLTDLSADRLAAAALRPGGQEARPNQLLRAAGLTGRRDPLTELQQKILTAAIALTCTNGRPDQTRTVYGMKIGDFLALCGTVADDLYAFVANETEKLVKKGVWLYDERTGELTRTQWFQSIGFNDGEIVFRFSATVLALIAAIEPGDTEHQLVKGIQYKGKHTRAVFEIIWARRAAGVVEYSISELMQLLALEHTRYSYGQLRLRVLEPSIQEIYDWDGEIAVRFGPTFSGRRVEGVWFEVKTGDEAREIRKKEPQFRFAPPEERPGRDG
ncbi:replication initiation protein [Anaeroselena agilis]|uniref:Replication initiation protein n=1 Tax=Anaeroselena agilis TaxID=3063788 RepID=A0ABU3NSK0_9FIRM|nr:replication initiation protein [Selenomonadales bacterium 4137-cl]